MSSTIFDLCARVASRLFCEPGLEEKVVARITLGVAQLSITYILSLLPLFMTLLDRRCSSTPSRILPVTAGCLFFSCLVPSPPGNQWHESVDYARLIDVGPRSCMHENTTLPSQD